MQYLKLDFALMINRICLGKIALFLLSTITVDTSYAIEKSASLKAPSHSSSENQTEALALTLPIPTFKEKPQTTFEIKCKALNSGKFKNSNEKLHAIFDLKWSYDIQTSPEFATYVGEPIGQDQYSDRSLDAIALKQRERRCFYDLIRSFDRASLTNDDDRLSYDLFLFAMQREQESYQFPSYYLTIDQMNGFHQDIPQLFAASRRSSINDFENLLSRLEKLPKLIEQEQALLREGLKRGITPPQKTLVSIPQQIQRIIDEPLAQHSYLEAFTSFPTIIPLATQKDLRRRAEETFSKTVLPSFKSFHNFLSKEYVPHARTTIALSAIPLGPEWYKFNAKYHTTTPLTPQEIHDIGIAECDKLTIEMDRLMRSTGWKKSRKEFFDYLRHDPKFFFKTKEQLLSEYRNIAKKIDPTLQSFFGRLPRLPYGIKAVPDFAAKETSTAYYESGSIEAGRSGWFVANTYNLKIRPRWEMETLTFHEAVPGHHLQISIAKELSNLPRFRKHIMFTSFIEGWGLYAESLGKEMGFYQDPYSMIGHIAYDLWRSSRLVVDTGIHALGWSREKAIEFMADRLPKSIQDIEVEVDRYIVMPGQALAYKIGQMKITEIRKRAEIALGEHFDVRKFHDAILESGALPLSVLENKMEKWISEQVKQVKDSQ